MTLADFLFSLAAGGLRLWLVSALLIGVGLAASAGLRRRGPAAASFACRLTVSVTLLAVPFCLAPLPVLPPASVPAAPVMPSVAHEAIHSPVFRQTARVAPAATPPSGRGTDVSPEAYVLFVWLLGSAALLFQLCLGQLALRRLHQQSRVVTDGWSLAMLRRLCAERGLPPPALRTSDTLETPILAGIARPALYLPARAETEYDAPTLLAVFAHELAHLARRDCAWFLLSRLACALAWPQPGVWILARALTHAAEECCDHTAIAALGAPTVYAQTLVRLAARASASQSAAWLGAAILPPRRSLERRIRAMFTRSRLLALPPAARASLMVGFATLLCAALLLFGGLAPQPPARAQAPTAPPSGLWEKPVSLTSEDIPFSDLLRKFAKESGLTCSIDPALNNAGPVTISINDTPAQIAFHAILNAVTTPLRFCKTATGFTVAPLVLGPDHLPAGRVSLNLQNVTASQALDALFENTSFGNIGPHDLPLADYPVRLLVKNTTCRAALEAILEQSPVSLKYEAHPYGIEISTTIPLPPPAPSEPVGPPQWRCIDCVAEDMPVTQILAELCKKNGISFMIDPNVPPTVMSVNLKNAPIDTVLKTLLSHVSPQPTWAWEGNILHIKAPAPPQ